MELAAYTSRVLPEIPFDRVPAAELLLSNLAFLSPFLIRRDEDAMMTGNILIFPILFSENLILVSSSVFVTPPHIFFLDVGSPILKTSTRRNREGVSE